MWTWPLASFVVDWLKRARVAKNSGRLATTNRSSVLKDLSEEKRLLLRLLDVRAQFQARNDTSIWLTLQKLAASKQRV